MPSCGLGSSRSPLGLGMGLGATAGFLSSARSSVPTTRLPPWGTRKAPARPPPSRTRFCAYWCHACACVRAQTLRAYQVPVAVTKRLCGQMTQRRSLPLLGIHHMHISIRTKASKICQQPGQVHSPSGGNTIRKLGLQLPLCSRDSPYRTQLLCLQALP